MRKVSWHGPPPDRRRADSASLLQPEVTDNEIPEVAVRPSADPTDAVRNNEILLPERGRGHDEQLANVLMSHAAERSVFNKTEVLAGGWSFPRPLPDP